MLQEVITGRVMPGVEGPVLGARAVLVVHFSSTTPEIRFPGHLAVLCVQAPDVRAGPQAEIGVVPLGFVNPLPAQVLPEVNVELTNTAVLFCGAEAVVGVQGSAVAGAVQVLGPLQRGGHEEQEGPVHAVNGGEVTPAAGTEPVNVHLKSVIFTVTGTVGTEAKALYFLSAGQPLPHNSSDVKGQPLR